MTWLPGGSASDDGKGSNKGPSWWGFGHCSILLTTGEPFEAKFLRGLRYVFFAGLKRLKTIIYYQIECHFWTDPNGLIIFNILHK